MATHDVLKRLAADLDTTVGDTVTLAVRALGQDRMGQRRPHPSGMTRSHASMPTSGDVVDLDFWPA